MSLALATICSELPRYYKFLQRRERAFTGGSNEDCFLRQWHDGRGALRHGGQRVSRHYYDAHQLMQAPLATEWQNDQALAIDCARHARLFFGSADLALDIAVPGTFTLTPSAAMRAALEKDYDAMAGIVFGEVPRFDAVLDSAERFEQIVNAAAQG